MKMLLPTMMVVFSLVLLPTSFSTEKASYIDHVTTCLDQLIKHGRDEYGTKQGPIFVSILDVETKTCPQNPKPLDEAWRVTRRERRNPAGANLLHDQPLIKTMMTVASLQNQPKYKQSAHDYMETYMKHLADEKGFFWWGWHRHYDVYKDQKDGHSGNHHEIHAIHAIAWDHLWEVNPEAVRQEIDAIWEWHVIDKKTGEINRHGDGNRGCDFTMSGGAIMHAFAFLYTKTQEPAWLDRAKLIAKYYWERRNPQTDLIPERPNAGSDRFDGGSFVTAITGCYCHALMKCYELTGESMFLDHALAYLKAYAKYGYDPQSGLFWGALKLDGTPIPGPRMKEGYAKYEPRGHLDLWEPYVAGYQFPLYTAQAYAHAFHLSREPLMLQTAQRFARWIVKTPPGSQESENTWYDEYNEKFGHQGTYAEKYGRAISFFLHLYALTKDKSYLDQARTYAERAMTKLHHKGLFRGHPAKPYYEAVDGVGFLLYALVELEQATKSLDHFIQLEKENKIHFDNW